MKKAVLFTIAVFCYAVTFSQTFNYQAAVRDAGGNLITDQAVGVRVRLLSGGPTGTVIFNETHTVTSNAYGIIDLPVGEGIVDGNFTSFHSLGWSNTDLWIDIWADITGGTNYVQLGTSQFRYVPYAMYAINSGNAANANHVFGITNNVVSNESGNNIQDDFVFGSSQLDNNGTFNPAFGNRMFFDKSKAAFRAGYTTQDQWDEAKVGDYSVALGEGGIASGRGAFSMGRNANATGLESFAFGINAGGFADYAKGLGQNARAFGEHATAIGRQVIANSLAEIQLGQYSTYVTGSTNTWVPTDRLFVIGNGQEDINLALNSDALVMLKNGNTTLNGTLTIDGDNQGTGAAFTLPAQDGTVNQIMSTDGAGNVTWVSPAAAAIPNGGNNGEVLSTDGSGALSWVTKDDADADPTNEIELPTQTGEDGKFLTTDGTAVSWQDTPNELPTGGTSGQVLSTDGSGVYSWANQSPNPALSTTNDVTSNGLETYGTNDFVFGAPTNVTGSDIAAANRIFFDKSKAAIRVGRDIGGQDAFGDVNIGAYSAAFGINPKAAGENSFAAGFLPNASGWNSVAMGNTVSATGGSSVALGQENTASGAYSVALGVGNTAETYGQTTIGYLNTDVTGNTGAPVATDRLFVIGNGTSDFSGNNNSDALVMLKNGNTTINGELTIDGDNQGMGASYTFPAQDGTANQIMSTNGSGAVTWIDAPSGGSGANLPAGGTDGFVLKTDGAGNYAWVTNDDADNDATNEIELPTGGTNGQILSTDGSGVYSWITDAVNDADSDATNEIELPVGGSNGQVLSTDGSGVYSWVNDATGTSTFSTTTNVTSNAPGTIATDDFVFGSTQLANDTGTTNDDNRIFFDKSKAAFRAGSATGNEWDDANVGVNSIGLGQNAEPRGVNAIAIGTSVEAIGNGSIGLGNQTISIGDNSITIGNTAVATSKDQIVLGTWNSPSLLENPTSWVTTDQLLVVGNGTSAVRSNALVMLKNGNTTLNGSLTIDGDNAGAGTPYTLPAQDGSANQVMTTDGSGNVTWAAAASDGDSDPTNEIELPTQTGNSGKMLSTNGTSPSWVDAPTEIPAGGTNGQVLSTNGSGVYSWTTDAVNDADNDPTNEIELPAQAGQTGKILTTDGTNPSWTNTIEATSVKIPSLPAFNVTSNGTSYTSVGEKEVGDWNSTVNTDLFNDGNHLNITNGRFTAPVDGLYFFSAQVRIDGINTPSGSNYSRLMIVKNGNKQSFRNGLHSIRNADAGTVNYDTQHVSGILKLSAGDYVSVFVETTGDANFVLQVESGFNGYLVNKL